MDFRDLSALWKLMFIYFSKSQLKQSINWSENLEKLSAGNITYKLRNWNIIFFLISRLERASYINFKYSPEISVQSVKYSKRKLKNQRKKQANAHGLMSVAILLNAQVQLVIFYVYRFISGSTPSILTGWDSFFCFFIPNSGRK